MIKKVFILTLFLFISSPVWAATYYLRDDGTAAIYSTSSCSSANQAASISAHNAADFSPNDVIILCWQGGPFDGEDELVVPSSGTKGNPITYRGEASPGSKWHWQGSIITGQTAIEVNGKSHITIENIKCRYMTEFVAGVNNSDDLLIQNNTVEFCLLNAVRSYVSTNDCADDPSDSVCNDDWQILHNDFRCSGIGDGDAQIEAESARGWTIAFNEIYCEDVSGYPCASDANSEPFQAGVDGIILIDANNITIEYNKIHDHRKPQGCSGGGGGEKTSDDGENEIDGKSTVDITIRYNEIYGGSGNESMIIVHNCHAGNPENWKLYGNWFHDSQSGSTAFFTYAGQNNGDICSGFEIRGNIFSNLPSGALRFLKTEAGYTEDVKVYNNSFYKCGSGSTSNVAIYSYAMRGMNEIKNNLFQETENTKEYFIYHHNAEIYWTFTNNRAHDSDGISRVYWGKEGATDFAAKGSNNENSDPQFKNEVNDDFTTTTFVSGIKLGANYDDLLDEDTDWNGVLNGSVHSADPDNYNGGRWPMGALVFGSSEQIMPKIVLDQPRNLRIKK